MLPRVALNTTALLVPRTGIGTYVAELAGALAAAGEVDIYSFGGFHWHRGLPPDAASAIANGAGSKLRSFVRDWVPFGREMREAQRRIVFAAGLRRHGIVLYHEPNYVPLAYDVPVVVTVHDLSWLRHPDTHPAARVRWLERGMASAVERASAFIADSAFVAAELVGVLDVPASRVHVAHLGVGPQFRPRAAAETQAVLQRFGIVHGAYVLALGTLEPRKNIGHAVDAFARLPAEVRRAYPLVIAGAKGWKSEELESLLREQERHGALRFLGPVATADLPALYAGATAFVFPSLYEGFGLPPVEAMASGVPVLASNRGALPEVVGDAAILIDPDDALRTAAALRALLEDPAQAHELAQRGRQRASLFTWAACAGATAKVYRAVLRAC